MEPTFGGATAISSPLGKPAPPQAPALGRLRDPTVAVVDAFGLMNVATRAIGIGHLPRPDDVRGCLEDLGWSGEAAVLASVPEVRAPSDGVLDENEGQAWRWLNDVLDGYAHDLANDGDPSTIAVRGDLLPERRDDHDPLLREVAKKRVAELMLADLYTAACERTDADVVVFTDRVDISLLLEQLGRFGVPEPERVVRIGVHGKLYDLDLGVEGLPEPRWVTEGRVAPFVLLTEGMMASLVGVADRAYGRRYRSELLRGVPEADRWHVVRWDPIARGVVVSPDSAPEVEVVWPDALFLAEALIELAPDTTLEGGAVTLDLSFNPRVPCAVPVLAQGGVTMPTRTAVVVERDAASISVEIEGEADATISISHDGADLNVGDAVVLRRIHAVGDDWYLASRAGQDIADPEGGVPRVVEVTEIDNRSRVRDLDDGGEGDLVSSASVPEPDFPVQVGDRLFALHVDLGDEGTGFLPMSTPLAHLRDSRRSHREVFNVTTGELTP